MATLADVLVWLAEMSLGLMAGALLAEACVLVPFWRSAEPTEFLSWYRVTTERLHQFFG